MVWTRVERLFGDPDIEDFPAQVDVVTARLAAVEHHRAAHAFAGGKRIIGQCRLSTFALLGDVALAGTEDQIEMDRGRVAHRNAAPAWSLNRSTRRT